MKGFMYLFTCEALNATTEHLFLVCSQALVMQIMQKEQLSQI